MTRPFNGLPITVGKDEKTLFIPLPKSAQSKIAWGCSCTFCQAHPELIPAWDTLALSPDSRYTWTVHYPELTR